MSFLSHLVLVTLLALVACTPRDWPIPEGLTTDTAMRAHIMEVIPVGSSITDAQDRMQASGFECVFQWHGSWGGENNLNYLYCNRQDGGWMVQRVWQVAVMMQGVTVGDVRVATGLMGP